MKKKIGIDARLYSQTGIGTYLKNLIHFLDQKKIKDLIFFVYLMDEDFDKLKLNNKNIIKKRANFKWHTFYEQIGFLDTISKDKLDLMHFTYFSYPIFYQRKFIATVHDVTPILFKTGRASTKNSLIYAVRHLLFSLILKSQIYKAKKIITPTQVVRDQLTQLYGEVIKNKTVTVNEGVNYAIKTDKPNKETDILKGKFFIYVGNFYPHKNVENLISAFSLVKDNIKLILIGPSDFFTKRIAELIKNNKKIVIVNNPSIGKLRYYYKNAQALIHPSLSEGFGLPLLEATYFSCPVIASDIPVFKELLGNQYLSFDPYSIKDISEKLNYFIKHKPTYKYAKILDKFSFERMTDATLKIYREFIS